MSALGQPLPAKLSAEEANARTVAGQRRAGMLESRLARQYESSLRSTARRCAEAYRRRTEVLTASFWDPAKHPRHPKGDDRGGEFESIPGMPPSWNKVGDATYETDDGRFYMYRIPGLRPVAWNVEWGTDFSYEHQYSGDEWDARYDFGTIIVDGAASFKDAKALFLEWWEQQKFPVEGSSLTAAVPPDHRQPPQPTVDEVMQAELAAASAAARTQATRRRMAQVVAGEILVGFGPEPGLRAVLEPLVRQQAGVQAERLVEGTRDAVASILLDALTEGWTVPETATRIQSVLTEQAAWRATMLARTDLIALSNGAAHQAARILGDAGPQYKTWLTAGDERVRESHVDANRQTVGVEQPYQVGDSLLQYPGDPAGSDGETINCRCVSIFSDSPAPTLRHSHAGGIDGGIAVLAAGFDPARHPHLPSGAPARRGGQWASTTALRDAHLERVESGISEFVDGIVLHGLQARTPGEGDGGRFLEDLIAYSESTGKPIYLTPEQTAAGLGNGDLEAWYGRHGFRWAGKKMVREPRFSLQASADVALSAAEVERRQTA